MFWQVFYTSFLFLTTVSAIHKQYRDNFDCARRTILFVRILATNWNRNKKRRQQQKNTQLANTINMCQWTTTQFLHKILLLWTSLLILEYSSISLELFRWFFVSVDFYFSLFCCYCCCYLLWNCSRIVYYIFFFFSLLRLPNQFTHKYIRFWVLRWENKLKCFIYTLIRRTRTDQTPIEQFNLFFWFFFQVIFPSHLKQTQFYVTIHEHTIFVFCVFLYFLFVSILFLYFGPFE